MSALTEFHGWLDTKAAKLHWYDIGAIKISVMALALLIAKWWPAATSLSWGWYAAVCLLVSVPPFWRAYLSPGR